MPFALAWYSGWAFEKIFAPLGSRPPHTRHTVGITGRDLDIDCARAREELGWETKVSYHEAMERIREWVHREM